MNSRERLKIALKNNLRETLYLFTVGVIISVSVGDNYEPIWGVWTFPLIFIAAFSFFFIIKYLPNLKADKELLRWKGQKYSDELQRQLQLKTYGQLLRENWFCKYLRKEEKDDPP